MKRMHYLKKGLNISLLIAFTGIYESAKLQTVMFDNTALQDYNFGRQIFVPSAFISKDICGNGRLVWFSF